VNLKEMLENARQKEKDIHLEYERRTEEYKRKVLENDEIRRQLEKEEKELKEKIPKEHFEKDSEWSKVLEEIRVLERLVGDE
jgi:hypothetical protein